MPFDPNTFREDIKLVKKHGSNVQNDTALMNRLNSYVDSGLVTNEDVNGIIQNDSVPSHVWGVVDSLKIYNLLKPVVATVEKPVKKTAMETILGAVFPRTVDRYNEGKTGLGGDVVAGGLDVASLIPRISSNIQQAPIALSNMVQSNKPPQQALKEYFSNIGDTQGKSFQTLNAPEWLPDIVQTAANKMQPINQGIGEFITSVARGPLLPGSFGKGIVGGLVGKMSPGAIKTALGLVGNVGTGAALGTSESVARGEGVDPFGTTLGATLGGALPFIGKGASTLANRMSDKRFIGDVARTFRNEYDQGNISEVKLGKIIDYVDNPLSEAAKLKLAMEQDAGFTQMLRNPNENITIHPTIKQAYDDYTGWRGGKTEPLIGKYRAQNPTSDKSSNLSVEEQIVLGKLGNFIRGGSMLGELLTGHTPARIMRELPDATVVNPSLIRGGNMLKDYLTNFSQQDSTKR